MTISPEIILTETQSGIESITLKLSGRPRHCSRNAFKLIRQAWLIRNVAPEMAAFAAITAEEEAATALIFALKIRRYKGSDKLKPKDHLHKTGLAPMVAIVGKFFADSNFPPVTLKFSTSSETARIDAEIDLTAFGFGHNRKAMPAEPLDILVSSNNEGNNAAHNFDKQLKQFASNKDVTDFLSWIEREKNLRNEVMYAGDDGIPNATNLEPFIKVRLSRITALIGLTIIILQARTPQTLATQVLSVYLDTLPKLGISTACETQS